MIRTVTLFCLLVATAGAEPPDYRPERPVVGTIRSWGDDQMGDLLKRWEAGFHRYQPGVQFYDNLKGTASAQFGLQEWVADLAVMGRRIYPYEYYGTYRRSLMVPIEIAVATGSFDVPHKSYALTVFVHRDNPLSRLTLGQLDRIFGTERTGGWQGLEWHREIARGPERNIRTWGQLGLGGAWADKPIHAYGPPLIAPGGISFFQSRVMGGADTWNEGLREYADRRAMTAALAKDRYGIAYTGMCYRNSEIKPLALAEQDGGPYVPPSRETVAHRTYPLSRTVYFYLTADTETGDPASPRIPPRVKEFIRYVLSREGQAAVEAEGDFLPLTAKMAAEGLKKLER